MTSGNTTSSPIPFTGGRKPPFSVYRVFDPSVRKREARLAKSIIRRYDERGIYYEWDDGPHGWD